MKTLEERIELCAAHACVLAGEDWLGLDKNGRHDFGGYAEAMLKIAFPELFDGTHVLLPREPTEEMRRLQTPIEQQDIIDKVNEIVDVTNRLQAHEQSQHPPEEPA